MRYKLLAVAVVLIAAGLALAPLGTADRQANRNFTTHLDGQDNDVDTPAQGEAIFHISRDGDSISYRLIVANIENVAQAHIHLAPAGSNGPVVVWLYPDGPPPELIEGRFSGVLATGTFTEADLVGPLEGRPDRRDACREHLRERPHESEPRGRDPRPALTGARVPRICM
jgi:hypothetical protein